MRKVSTRIISSYFHTPRDADRRLFHAVLRAGHIKTAPDYRIERHTYPGHDLLLCVAGRGTIRCAERSFKVDTGQLAWIDCSRPHAHWPEESAPWELLWIRAESPQLALLADALDVQDHPVFTLRNTAEAVTTFEYILKLLRERSLTMDASLHAAASTLIAMLYAGRQSEIPRSHRAGETEVVARLHKVLARMQLEYRRAWKVEDLARVARMSVPYFFRCFNKTTGSSPLDWLRHERINQAKRKLIETNERISDVAEQVGYRDPFYFSRDFKKLTAISPRQYRLQERFNTASQ